MCASLLSMCYNYMNLHAVACRYNVRTITLEQVQPCMSCNWGNRQTMSADRQTDLGTAVYKSEYSIYSEVHLRILSSGICESGWRHRDGQKTAMSWAKHIYTDQSVKDAGLSKSRVTWCDFHPLNQEPSEPHITHTVHRAENHTTSCISPSLP